MQQHCSFPTALHGAHGFSGMACCSLRIRLSNPYLKSYLFPEVFYFRGALMRSLIFCIQWLNHLKPVKDQVRDLILSHLSTYLVLVSDMVVWVYGKGTGVSCDFVFLHASICKLLLLITGGNFMRWISVNGISKGLIWHCNFHWGPVESSTWESSVV